MEPGVFRTGKELFELLTLPLKHGHFLANFLLLNSNGFLRLPHRIHMPAEHNEENAREHANQTRQRQELAVRLKGVCR